MLMISILSLIVVYSTPSFKNQLFSIILTRVTTMILIFSGLLSLNVLYIQEIGSGIGIYSGLYNITNISQYMDTFIYLIGSIILVAWHTRIYQNQNGKEYSLIILFSSFGASLLVSSADLISMYLSIELQSFGVYILSTLFRDSESATSAGLKYFLLGGLSSCFILLGAGIIYSNLGVSSFESIFSLASSIYGTESIFMLELSLGLFFILGGFLLKIAAAPFHFWAPDVYDGTPTIVTIWLQTMPKLSILTLLIEILTLASTGTNLSKGTGDFLQFYLTYDQNLYNIEYFNSSILYYLSDFGVKSISSLKGVMFLMSKFLILSCILSLIFGSVVGLAQNRIKRLFAYSTISHVGFILIGLSLMTVQSINSILLYLIIYSLTNLLIFFSIIGLGSTYGLNDLQNLDEFKNSYILTLLSLSLTIGIFSLAGIPPLSGFFSKAYMLQSALNINIFTCFIAISTSVISAVYYLKLVILLHTSNPFDIIRLPHFNFIPSLFAYSISFTTFFTLLFPFFFNFILFSTLIESISLFPDNFTLII